jgi:hypothetical protein
VGPFPTNDISKALQECSIKSLIHVTALVKKIKIYQTLHVKESDQHHLEYWPQVQPFLKWRYQSDMVDSLNALSLNACCCIQYTSVELLQSCSKFNAKMFLLKHIHLAVRKKVKHACARSASLTIESTCHLLPLYVVAKTLSLIFFVSLNIS